MIDPKNAVVLSMDFQHDIVTNMAPTDAGVLERVARVQEAARAAGVPVVHVAVRFRPGHPEISPNGRFKMVRDSNMMVEGTPGADFHASVAPKPGDIIVTKKRVSAFAGSDLEYILRAAGRTHLVLMGVATSGVVLSTIRQAADLDFSMSVVRDCCADREPDVHEFLIDRVFTRMATAVVADDVVKAFAG